MGTAGELPKAPERKTLFMEDMTEATLNKAVRIFIPPLLQDNRNITPSIWQSCFSFLFIRSWTFQSAWSTWETHATWYKKLTWSNASHHDDEYQLTSYSQIHYRTPLCSVFESYQNWFRICKSTLEEPTTWILEATWQHLWETFTANLMLQETVSCLLASLQ